ncbi:MAG TPA: D-tagatose-bisphosphate aldolase, class II, non-catalytic subunit [Terriglobales bacterium]
MRTKPLTTKVHQRRGRAGLPQAKTTLTDEIRDIILRNRERERIGIVSVCSAHPRVLEAAMRQAIADDTMLCVESTSNQVNQFGGYTGLTPSQFAGYLAGIARQVGFPSGRILLGGDHLGPYPWRREPSRDALHKASVLVRSCVLAGYVKIHLDASMACADDVALDDQLVATRAADLCRAAEEAWEELPEGSPRLQYVIGTEVPVPGGEASGTAGPQPTKVDDSRRTLEIARAAFLERGLDEAWERVIGLVVQPGVEFGDAVIFDYDRKKASALSANLPASPALVYEAHSTDYQKPEALRQMVEDHFAILKVGPWLTFVFREAVFALSAVEREWLGSHKGFHLSQVSDALEKAMLRNPEYWKDYYPAQEPEAQFARRYSFSDRCRYYWPDAAVQKEVDRLLKNLSNAPIPLTLLSQHLPEQYERVREGKICNTPESLIEDRIRQVLRFYSAACGNLQGYD